jgi:AraC-like DNA-binding protein
VDLEIATTDHFRDLLAADGISLQLTGDRIEVDTHLRWVRLTPEIAISAIKGVSHGVLRTGARGDSADLDRVTLSIRGSGQATTFEPLDRSVPTLTLTPSRAILFDNGRPYVCHQPSWSDEIFVEVDRRRLIAVTGGERRLSGSFLAGSPLMSVLTAVLRQTIETKDTLTLPEASTLADTSIDLLAALVASQAEGREVLPTGRQALLRTLLADLEHRMGDPALGPGDLATRHHISVRYVHSLFSDIDATPAGYIRELRLRRAAQTLADPARKDMTITAIAHLCGFGDHGTFVRAFRRHFGLTPTDQRREAHLAGSPQPVPNSHGGHSLDDPSVLGRSGGL